MSPHAARENEIILFTTSARRFTVISSPPYLRDRRRRQCMPARVPCTPARGRVLRTHTRAPRGLVGLQARGDHYSITTLSVSHPTPPLLSLAPATVIPVIIIIVACVYALNYECDPSSRTAVDGPHTLFPLPYRPAREPHSHFIVPFDIPPAARCSQNLFQLQSALLLH